MIKHLKKGDLFKTKTGFEGTADVYGIVLKPLFRDDDGIRYFQCLINERKLDLCEIWISKIYTLDT